MSFTLTEKVTVGTATYYRGAPRHWVARAERRAGVAPEDLHAIGLKFESMVSQLLGRLSSGYTMGTDELAVLGFRGPVAQEAIDHLLAEGLIEVRAEYGSTRLLRITEAGRLAHRGLMIEQRVAARQREAA